MNELNDMVNEFGTIYSNLQALISIVSEIESQAEDNDEQKICRLFVGIKYYLEHLDADMREVLHKIDLYELKLRNKITE